MAQNMAQAQKITPAAEGIFRDLDVGDSFKLVLRNGKEGGLVFLKINSTQGIVASADQDSCKEAIGLKNNIPYLTRVQVQVPV